MILSPLLRERCILLLAAMGMGAGTTFPLRGLKSHAAWKGTARGMSAEISSGVRLAMK